MPARLSKRRKPRVKRRPRRPELGDLKPVPGAVLARYPGKHVVYSDPEERVIGVGETLAEAIQQAEASGVPEPWHFSYSFLPDEAYML